MRGEKATRPCAACGRELTRLVSQARGKNWYCDNACQAAHAPHRITLSETYNPLRGQQDTRPCANCGAPVTRYLSQARSSKSWTCSRSCKATIDSRQRVIDGTWKRPQKPRKGDHVDCRVCGKNFYRQPAYIKQGRFLCSRVCNKAWQSRNQTEKICPVCGTSFVVRPSETFIQTCSRDCQVKARTKRATGRMHNGRPVLMTSDGYLSVYEPDHPSANRHSGRVLEHRLIVEQQIGRYLTRDETINHIDHVRSNNAPENLEILSPSDHSRETGEFTRRQRAATLAELEAYRAKFGPLESATD